MLGLVPCGTSSAPGGVDGAHAVSDSEDVGGSRIREIIAEVRASIEPRTAIVLTFAAFILVVFKTFGTPSFFRSLPIDLVNHRRSEVFGDLWWFASCFVLLGVLPMILLSRIRGVEREELGLQIGDWRFGLQWVIRLYALMLPLLVIVSHAETFYRHYPLDEQLAVEAGRWLREGEPQDWLKWFVIYEIGYALYFIGWEYFYRGFLTLGLYKPLGYTAVLIGNVPFALMHAGKPFPEAVGSIFAGLALGWFAIRARSFWWCWLLHALIACTMDLLAIERRFALGQ